jgi:hypothetical protein
VESRGESEASVQFEHHPEALKYDGDLLEFLQQMEDLEYFCGWLVEGLGNS